MPGKPKFPSLVFPVISRTIPVETKFPDFHRISWVREVQRSNPAQDPNSSGRLAGPRARARPRGVFSLNRLAKPRDMVPHMPRRPPDAPAGRAARKTRLLEPLPEKSIAREIQSEKSLPEKSKPKFGWRIRAMAPRKTRYFPGIWKNRVFWGGNGSALKYTR